MVRKTGWALASTHPLWVLGKDGGTGGEMGARTSTLTLSEQISVSSWTSAFQG